MTLFGCLLTLMLLACLLGGLPQPARREGFLRLLRGLVALGAAVPARVENASAHPRRRLARSSPPGLPDRGSTAPRPLSRLR
jgi:hypothetical protein